MSGQTDSLRAEIEAAIAPCVDYDVFMPQVKAAAAALLPIVEAQRAAAREQAYESGKADGMRTGYADAVRQIKTATKAIKGDAPPTPSVAELVAASRHAALAEVRAGIEAIETHRIEPVEGDPGIDEFRYAIGAPEFKADALGVLDAAEASQ